MSQIFFIFISNKYLSHVILCINDKYVSHIFFSSLVISFLAFDIAFLPGRDLIHLVRKFLGGGYIKLARLHAILLRSNEYLLVWVDYFHCGIVELDEIFL